MAKKSKEEIEKVKDALGPNVIIGDKAIVYFYHRPDGRGVIDELAEHHFAGEFVDWAVDSAQRGIDETGWNFKPDTDRRMLPVKKDMDCGNALAPKTADLGFTCNVADGGTKNCILLPASGIKILKNRILNGRIPELLPLIRPSLLG